MDDPNSKEERWVKCDRRLVLFFLVEKKKVVSDEMRCDDDGRK